MGAKLLHNALQFGRRFVLVPLFLWAWGAQTYGEWLALAAAVGSLSLLNIGMHNYVANRLRQCYARGQRRAFVRFLHSGLRLAGITCGLGVAGLLVFALVAPLSSWLGFKHTGYGVAGVTVFLLGIFVLSRIPTGLIIGVYRSVGEYGRGGMMENAILTGQVVFMSAALLTKSGLPIVALAQLLPVWIGAVTSVWDIQRRHPDIAFGLARGQWPVVLRMVGPSALFLLISLSHVLTLQGSMLVLSVYCGEVVVVLFATTRVLASAVRKLTSILRQSIWPEFTALQAEEELVKMRWLHIGLAKLSLMVTFAVAISLRFVGGEFYRFWTRRQLEFDPLLLTILLGYATTAAVWESSVVVALSSNRHRGPALRYLAAGLAGVLLCVVLVPHFGAAGAALALWVADVAFRVVGLPLAVCRLIDQSPLRFWAAAVLRGLPALACTALAAWACSALTVGTPFHLFAVPAAATATMAGMGLCTWLDPRERGRLLGLTKLLRRR